MSLQAHSSVFHAHTMLEGMAGSTGGSPLILTSDIQRERSLTLQALAHFEHQRLASYPELFFQGLEMQRGRETVGEDSGRTQMPTIQRNKWAVDEEIEEEEAEEGE